MSRLGQWKKIRMLVVFAFSALVLFAAPVSVCAMEGSMYTFSPSISQTMVRTVDAYMPGGIFLHGMGLKAPEDLFIKDKVAYIADTGNGQIVKYYFSTGKLEYVGKGTLGSPTGLHVDKAGNMFVADYGNQKVYKLSPKGEVLLEISKPESVLFGSRNTFKPRKVSLDINDNIYVISESSNEGILQFDHKGEFKGYFGTNVTKRTFLEALQDLIFSDAQKERLFHRVPKIIVNMTPSQSGVVFTVTQQDGKDAVKKINMAGNNILFNQGYLRAENNVVDIAVTPDERIFTISETGALSEYTSEGDVLFEFGGRALSSSRSGLIAVGAAISVDDENNIFVLDKEQGVIQVLYPTEYANTIHRALEMYNRGEYESSLAVFQDLIKLDPMSSTAHYGYGLNLFQLGKYEEALPQLKLSNGVRYYSQCFWELRAQWLRDHMTILLSAALIFAAIMILYKVFLKKKWNLASVGRRAREVVHKNKLADDLLYSFHMIRHPLDSLYDLKHNMHGSVLSATILYILALLVWVFSNMFSAFIFNTFWKSEWVNPAIMLGSIVLPVVLYVVGNYLISSINDGEGSFRNVYVQVAYCFSPYIVVMPLITLCGYVLTRNEAFLYNGAYEIMMVYVAVLLFLGAKETHNYTVGKTIKNLLLTIAFIVLVMVAMMALYMLFQQFFEFVLTLFEEVRYRV